MLKFLFSSFLLTLLLSITACNTNPNKSSQSAFTLDTDCNKNITKAFEKLIETSMFLRVSENAKAKQEIMKINEQYFTRLDGEEWEKLEEDPSNIYKSAIEGIQSGDIKIADCKVEGSKTLNGVETHMISYKREMAFSPEFVLTSDMKFYIGKGDALPYMETEKSTSINSKTTFQYKNIIAPKI